MKQQVNYEIGINVDFKDPEKATAHFLSKEFLGGSDYDFANLGDVAGVISQIILRNGLNRKTCYVEEIGTFHRDETIGHLHLTSSAFGEIEIQYDQPYYSAIKEGGQA